ncbi:uncharacterized protein LOC127129504 [Lathyrus oleraceus]|uniref:uncharacterized protein LOC127129504 n=1 Tax=Pisum sativum TaxID=3888 RepID=UPI0021CE4BDD|nr:uncharacterized protein LOC127129504 [Pisum sativum]
MSQPSVSTPSKSSKEQATPNNIITEIDLSDVIIDVVSVSTVLVHATPMRKVRISSSRKSKPTKVSTSSTPSITARNMNDLEPPTGVNKPMSMTSLYDVDKNIRVLISQVLGIDPKKNVVSDVFTSLAQLDNNTENPKNNPDVHAPTLSPEKSQDKERSEDIINELGNKDKNLVDQPTSIVNIEELDSNDVPIGQRLAPGIDKRLKNRKGQVVGSSITPSDSVRKKANVGTTKIWSKVVTPTPKKKSLKRNAVPSESSESDQDVEHNVHDIISTSKKQASGKKIPANIPEVPLDDIFFHYLRCWKM